MVDPERELAELKEYLGSDYEHARLVHYEQQLDAEYASVGDEALFYRRSEGYLYNLTAFAMSRTKVPYLNELTRHVPPGSRLLDYGCGIGSDGLSLIDAGYRVTFADFENPSTRYLSWRLAQRGLSTEVYDLDRTSPPEDFDLAYAFDVIEHVDDQFALLRELERRAALVLVNFLEPEPGGTPLHHRDLPLSALLDHVAARRLLHYRVYHGRSHLVLYGRERERERKRGVGALRSRARRLRGAASRRSR